MSGTPGSLKGDLKLGDLHEDLLTSLSVLIFFLSDGKLRTLHGRLFMLDDLESKSTVSGLWGNTKPRENAHLYDVGPMIWEIKKKRGIL